MSLKRRLRGSRATKGNHMDELSADSLADIERVVIDVEKMSKFGSEEEFTALAVSLMIETGSYVCVAACTMGTKPTWDRDQAAICGNMVRLYKLLHSVLDQTCQRRQETSFILARLVFETSVNIRYLIDNFSPELIDSYVSYSFRHERKLRDVIDRNVAARSGVVLPIEDRMLKSIYRSADAAKIALDEIDPRRTGPWGGKNLFEKAEAVGLGQAYLAAFGGASHSVHGNWHEIYGNHLHWDESGGFTPNLDWHTPRPQVLFALCSLVIDTLGIYFAFLCNEQAAELFHEPLSDLRDRIDQVSDAHEAYLANKKWPEI
jgi:hypothetical protein